MTGMQRMDRLVLASCLAGGLAVAACASAPEPRRGTTTPVDATKPPAADQPAATPPSEPKSETVVELEPEKREELSQFFARKVGPVQSRCYGEGVEKMGKKPEGRVSFSFVLRPGGKASDGKVTESSLHAPEIEECVIREAHQWIWPDVPAPSSFTGSIHFKSAL